MRAQLYIRDTSRNGVAINSLDNRLVYDSPCRLRSGDPLFIEPFEIEVVLDTEDERPSLDFEHDPFALPRYSRADLRDPAPPSSEAGELDPLVFLKPEAGSPKPSRPATRRVDDLLGEHYAPPTSVPASSSSSGELDVEPIPAGTGLVTSGAAQAPTGVMRQHSPPNFNQVSHIHRHPTIRTDTVRPLLHVRTERHRRDGS